MAFNYTFNAGKLSSEFNKSGYLYNNFGFSNANALTLSSNSLLSNTGVFDTEYSAKFGKNLAISDDYKSFTSGDMDNFLSSSEISYTSNTAVSRTDAYKELFLQTYKPSASSASLAVTGSYNAAYGVDVSTTATMSALYTKLESEANTLKAGLNTSELAYGGYPEIAYSSTDSEVELLKKQLDVAMQDFVKVYDDLFASFKIKAGGHAYDNQGNGDKNVREQEAATAATMTASLAMNYAEKYYSQSIKPTAANYVFGQAPLIFAGKDQTAENAYLANSLSDYTDVSNANLQNILLNNNSGYEVNHKVYANSATGSYMWDMNYQLNLIQELGNDKGSEIRQDGLNELGGTIPAYINWMVRDSFAVGGVTPDIMNKTYCSSQATFLSGDMVAAAEKLVDLKMKIQAKTVESSINNKARAEYESRVGAMNALQEIMNCTGTDPYTVNIDGKNYMLGQDKNDDGTINNITELLGIKDSQDNVFESLKKLDTNNDGYVSQEEMKAQNIILNAVDNESGQLTNVGYDMSLVKGINLAELQNKDGKNNLYGSFTMDLQDKKANGNLTFEGSTYFDKLFGSVVDFSALDSIEETKSSDAIVIPSSVVAKPVPISSQAATAEVPAVQPTVQTAQPAVQPTDVPSTTEPKTYSLFDAKNFSFDFVSVEDNKSAFEKLLDQLCWQMNIKDLTSTQKYGIIDGIDANQDVAIAKTEIQQELEKINLSA